MWGGVCNILPRAYMVTGLGGFIKLIGITN